MKRAMLPLLLLFSATLLMGSNAPKGEDQLRAFVNKIKGTWITDFQFNENLGEELPELLIHINPSWVEKNQVKIVVSEYCQDGLADFLVFELQDDKLIYVGASKKGCSFDLCRLDFIYLRPETQEGDTMLTYEAQETEYANYQYLRLRRMPPSYADGLGWACHLQGFLTTYLRDGQYQIHGADGNLLSLEEAFGSEAPLEDLAFVNEHPVLFPMLEEHCVTTAFNIVLMGEAHPGGEMQIFAVEWRPEAIYLYETEYIFEYDEDTPALVQGVLRFYLTPDFVKPPHVQP
jgi:hypothetical protein